MTPAEFLAEYVRPAIALWDEEPDSPVRAVCVLAQIDILAEVVAATVLGGDPSRRQVSQFRDALGEREAAISRVRDAHDSHKHGRLGRPTAEHVTEGQRPYRSAGTAFFLGHSYVGDFLGRTDTSLLMDDSTPVPVGRLIHEAMEAWERELQRLCISV